jgi:hypothetical protein
VDVLLGEIPHAAGEGRSAGEAVVEQNPDGVDIAALGRLHAHELLRGHVAGTAHDLTRLPDIDAILLDDPGDAEVGHLHGPGRRHQYVRWLYVPVDDAASVGVGERPQELRRHPAGELLVQVSVAVPAEELPDVLSGDALGHDKRTSPSWEMS